MAHTDDRAGDRVATGANLFGWDYRARAAALGTPIVPIVDIHLHVNGKTASAVYAEAMRLFGVERILTQSRLTDAEFVRASLGDAATFMAVPNWGDADRGHAFRAGFLESLEVWHARYGVRIAKLWGAPRLYEIVGGDPADCVPLDAPWRVRAAERATELGMMLMAHVADPDTWFATKYADAAKYRRKMDHLVSLERMLDRFGVPWIAAHMGGWPEDLNFLDGLLERHANLHLDTSATKWMVRALSSHPTARVREFFIRWQDRVLFGSDIVALEEHMTPRPEGTPPATPMSDLAHSPAEAFDLYASRYWALRTMFETAFVGQSPIADPDLKMIDPKSYDERSSPTLRGVALPAAVLRKIYRENALRVVYGWIESHRG